MLDQETKRRIDNARDILVGKVPDPKSQVEQITIALIYKFMDDIDKASEELGGEPQFFTDSFRQYSWSKLMDSKLSGQERLNLYIEAITKLGTHKNLPPLFRDIFKGAALPYREPSVLHLFIKEINGFTYDHSENLGNAFEYLLSVMGSQGDAGQFRTTRHIIDFIVDVVDPKKDETILDPACGTAGFLISAYKHILRQHDGEDDPSQKEKALTPDERERLMEHFVGYDISPDMVRLSLVNMYLHGFQSPKIFEYDTLSSEDRWDERYDVILANPPFMTPKGGIIPHKRFSIRANKAEILFLDYIANHINTRGRAGIIVPVGILFHETDAYVQVRKQLIENKQVWAVVSFPAGIFNPYSDAETSVIFLDKSLTKKPDEILFVQIQNDGFDLGNARNAIDFNDLPMAKKILTQYLQVLNGKGEREAFIEAFSDEGLMKLVSFETLAANNFSLNGKQFFIAKESSELVKLSELLVSSRESIDIDDKQTYRRITVRLYGKGVTLRDEVAGKNIKTKRQTLARKGQLIVSKIDARNGAIGIVPPELDGAIVSADFLLFDFLHEKVDDRYLSYLLSSAKFYDICSMASSGTTNRKRLNQGKFLSMGIALPDITHQREIAKTLGVYREEIRKNEHSFKAEYTKYFS